MRNFNTIITIAAATLVVSAAALPAQPFVLEETTACTTGTPMTTAGYAINYSHATPTQFTGQGGYQPESGWAGSHALGTYTYDVPPPIETGFAYAQFKCQFKCNSFAGSSFFVKYPDADNKNGSLCTCYDELLDPETFVADEETMVGAWNSICQ